jgi:hypothetical protein
MLFCLSGRAQIGGTGWVAGPVKFNVQSPTNAAQSARYFFTNNIYHCLVYSNDGAFSIGNTTQPRTEQRFTPDYTNGEIQYQATLMAPSNENSYCVFQIHTGDAESDTYGSTTFMLFWFTNNNGSVHDYSGTTLATGLGNQWFQLNVDHNLVTHTILVWVNGKEVWTQQDNGANDFYMKDGVYVQTHGPTYQMDTYITNSIHFWTSSGTNPPAAPTGLTAKPTLSQIALSWNASVGATNYNLKRAASSGGPYTTLTTLAGTNYTDPNVVQGTTYYYVVTALDQFGESANSTQLTASLLSSGYQLSATPATAAVLAGTGTNYTVAMVTNSTFSGTVTFGVIGLPAGASASFNPPALSAAGNSTLAVNTLFNTPGGNYVLVIDGTNGSTVYSNTVNLTVINASGNPGTLLWTSTGADTNWSTILDWTNVSVGGYGPPGSANAVVFTNLAAVSDSALTAPGSGVVVPANINSFVNGNFTIATLTNLNNAVNTTPNYQNIGLAAGSILNDEGEWLVGGDTGYDFGANGVVNLTVSGAGAGVQVNGVFAVNETSASTGVHNAILDLSGLDKLTLPGGYIKVGVEGSGNAHRATGTIYLARTNLITINNNGNVGFYIGHNKSTAPTISPAVYLGRSNAVFMANSTGIMVGRADTPGSLLTFNPAWAGENPTAYFRGSTATSRVLTWNVGDNSANSDNSANPTSGTNDFSGGTLDALVTTMELGVSCPAGASGTGNGTGTFTFDTGTLDVSTLELGVDTGNTGTSSGIGVMNVNGGLLNVDNSLQLGVFVAGSGGVPQGTLNVDGGTVKATNIVGAGLSTINLQTGLLNLQGGTIANVSTLAIGDGLSDPALLTSAASITSTNTITIAANGTLSGNTSVATPNLIVNGTISPGVESIGALTNNGTVTFGAGGGFSVTIQDANGTPVAGWDYLQVNGLLNIQAADDNPFTIQLQSFDPNGSGQVTNFNAGANYHWTIANATGGITNFSPDKFVVETDAFQNDLAGGTFSVQTNAGALQLVFTSHAPPIIGSVTFDGINMAVSGSGGVGDGGYYVLSTTNLALPLPDWTRMATNSFDDSGGFTFTNNLNPISSQNFYTIQIQ